MFNAYHLHLILCIEIMLLKREHFTDNFAASISLVFGNICYTAVQCMFYYLFGVY